MRYVFWNSLARSGMSNYCIPLQCVFPRIVRFSESGLRIANLQRAEAEEQFDSGDGL